jgi:hypothetical protein
MIVGWQISSMEFTKGIIVERVAHPDRGKFPDYDDAKEVAEKIGDNYFPWPVVA